MIKVAIIEDEKIEQERVESYFKRLSNEKRVNFNLSFYTSGEKFLFEFETGKFSIVLIDIELEGTQNGLEVSEKLRELDGEVTLIFLTNLAQYAIEGYKVNAFDYMLKPISYFDFSTRLTLVINKLETKNTERVIIQTDGKKLVILLSDIYYIEVNNHKVIYHTKKGNFQTYGSLKQILKELENKNFSLCNSCFLVNFDYVEKIEGYNVIVNGEELLISHPKRKTFLQELTAYFGK